MDAVKNGNDTLTYTYDNGGNILSVKQNGETIKTYTYGDSEWKDLLTEYNGQTISYDGIGNPILYRGKTLNWQNGRRLVGLTENGNTIAYAYDADGNRICKTVNGITTEYILIDGTLTGQITGQDKLVFLYDESGTKYGFTYNGATYYYNLNLQGDVIGIFDSTGTEVVQYAYDEWGKLLSVTGQLASTVGQINPIRYRGYYYDNETGFYYVSSRYYDPEIGRFLNADNQIPRVGGNINDYNLYSYCGNNPVNRIDPDGHAWKDIKNWFSNAWNKVKSVANSIKNTIKKSINNSAEKHYSRNNKNKVNDSVDTIMRNYTKVSEWADKYHENTSGRQGSQAKYNDKYLSPNGGHYEVIICNAPNIEPYIVDEFVDPLNMGTYNYAANDSFVLKYYVEHFFNDMVPYYLYGNTRDDDEGYLKWALD